jgi:Domain of unknown function (DUF1788)
MSSLKNRIELLECDLKAVPPCISVYHDLPFAILRYDPAEEWELRQEISLLGTRLENVGKEVHNISMSEFLWKAIDETEGMDVLVGLEREEGYRRAQDQVTTYLSDKDFKPLAVMLKERLAPLDTKKSIVFLTRVAVMSPGLYHMSKLLDEMKGKTRVITILCYPGSLDGSTELRFMNLRDRDALGNYRVKIYG